jgi:DNA polymerase III epsilon subunit-like protein
MGSFQGMEVVGMILIAYAAYFLYQRKKNIKHIDPSKPDPTLGKVTVSTKTLNKFKLPEKKGYVNFPVHDIPLKSAVPDDFIALSLETATAQPYSICLLGLTEYKEGKLFKKHYYYVKPPEAVMTNKNLSVDYTTLKLASTFEELWNAGLKDLLIGHIIIGYNSPHLIGCILHALQVYRIPAPELLHIDALEMAKKLYDLPSYKLENICAELSIPWQEHNPLAHSQSTADFFLQTLNAFPDFKPTIYRAT